jgi:hypothetical protein
LLAHLGGEFLAVLVLSDRQFGDVPLVLEQDESSHKPVNVGEDLAGAQFIVHAILGLLWSPSKAMRRP